MAQTYTIGVLGGTGQEGSGLALRLAKAGHNVILGSRDPARAAAAAEQMKAEIATARVSGASNKEAAAAADIVMLTVPFSAQRATVEDVRNELS